VNKLIAIIFLIMTCAVSARADTPSAAGLWLKSEGGAPVAWIMVRDLGGTFDGIVAKSWTFGKIGLELLRDMERDGVGLNYEGGTIADLHDGSIYPATMSLSPDGQSLSILKSDASGKQNETWQRLPETALGRPKLRWRRPKLR
jgi:hypothetical protein